MIYSSRGAPRAYRPRVYTVIANADITDAEFKAHYDEVVRYVSEKYKPPFVILDDQRVIELLREIGISPANITIYCTSEPVNKYKYNVHIAADHHTMVREIVDHTTHDILWKRPDAMHTFVQTIEKSRSDKNLKTPFVEEVY
jgi:hypothetical protein